MGESWGGHVESATSFCVPPMGPCFGSLVEIGSKARGGEGNGYTDPGTERASRLNGVVHGE